MVYTNENVFLKAENFPDSAEEEAPDRNHTFYTYQSHDQFSQTYITFTEVHAVLLTFFSLLGVISNVVTIKAFVTMGVKDAMVISYLFLSLSELAYVLGMMGRGLLALLVVVETETNFDICFSVDPLGLLIFFGNAAMLVYTLTILTTTYIALARCMCVVRPLQFKSLFTKDTTLLVFLVFVIFSVLTYFPIFMYMGLSRQFDVQANTTRITSWISPKRELVKDMIWGFRDTFLSIVTEVVVTLCVISMIKALHDTARFRNMLTTTKTHFKDSSGNLQDDISHRPGVQCHKEDVSMVKSLHDALRFRKMLTTEKKHFNPEDDTSLRPEVESHNKDIIQTNSKKMCIKERKVIIQVVLISISYIISNTPKICVNTYGIFQPNLTLGQDDEIIYLTLNAFIGLFQIFNSSVSFMIYYKYNTKFRASCKLCPEKESIVSKCI